MGEPSTESLECMRKLGILHMQLGNKNECLMYLEKYTSLNINKVQNYSLLFEAYHKFSQEKLKELA